jgi:2-furoyl-CoA dehydrogenase large subunit
MLQDRFRVEDPALLTGSERFIDDLPVRADTLHAAILRSPHAHARLLSLDLEAARQADGVICVFGGQELAEITQPLLVGMRLPMECWPLAMDKARYAGEPVAVVVARDRYLAEDAVDLIRADYEPLDCVVDVEAAVTAEAPVLFGAMETNLCGERNFRYGDPETAFVEADHTISVKVPYPRSSVTPIETYGVIAEFDPYEESFDITANFQGPFSIHPVIARALQVPGNRLRLRTPPASGGSFGVKQGSFPYIVLMAAAARLSGRPVKWVEDRLEHLTASVSATNRVIELKAAVHGDGRVTALDWDQLEDVGAYLRAPEPATIYRMHGNMCGAYDIPNLAIRNRIVVTNKTPTGLNRGFGGPQIYFALERLMQRIAVELELDPMEVMRRNLIAADAFPYHTASGAQYDSGDYQAALQRILDCGVIDDLKARQAAVRADGGLYGIGLTAVVEPSVSNMGYLSTALTPAQREKAGPKNGAFASATIAIDPVGAVTVQLDSVPQGQGHRTVAADVAAEVLGIDPAAIRVNAPMDTGKDAWSIAAGNYASRFAAAGVGVVKIAAERLRDRLARIASTTMNVPPDQLVFRDGRIFAEGNPDAAQPFARIASTSHWAPGTLPDDLDHAIRETAYWTPPELTAPTPEDGINSSLCHAFIFDVCGVEIERVTGQARIDRYVTMHDCGRILHQGMVDGQIRGGFANAIGAAIYEEYAYSDDGAFLAGTFADYPVPTVSEIPELEILHMSTPSPFTPLGTKGVGEGNCMSTPVCFANAVADALQPEKGWVDLTLPLSPSVIAGLLDMPEPAAPEGYIAAEGGKGLSGSGEATVAASRQEVWNMLLDPEQMAAVIPGAHGVRRLSPTHFEVDVTLGVGPVKGRYEVDIRLSDLDEPRAATLTGTARGALGSGGGQGAIRLSEAPEDGTTIHYEYSAQVGGKVASVGGRMLDGAAKMVIGQFFQSLSRKSVGGDVKQPLWRRLLGGRK